MVTPRPTSEPLEARRHLAATPQLVVDLLPPEAGYDPNQISMLHTFNGELYFVADDGQSGFELWRSDGTEAGTELVKEIAADGASSFPVDPVVSNNQLFFTADDGINGRALWKTDGTEEGTIMVMDVDPVTVGGEVTSLLDLNGILYFRANDGMHGTELWRSDGSPEGTWMVKDIAPGPGSSLLLSMVSLNGLLYFAANDGAAGWELRRSDGNEEGTWMVKDIRPGPASSTSYIVPANSRLYLAANDGISGNELWTSDGTEEGTVLVKDIHASGGSNPASILRVGGTVFFAATHAVNGTELWKTDGTEAGTVEVKNIRFLGSSNPNLMADYDGIAIFTAHDGTNGREVWRSDGTDAGTFRISNVSSADNPFIGNFLYQDGLIYFSADTGSSNLGTELLVTDGTLAGTQLVADLFPGTSGSSPSRLTILDGAVYFAAGGGVPHFQLWKLPDEIAPKVISSSFDFQTGHRVKVRFSEDVSQSLLTSSIQVQQLPGGPMFVPDSVQFDLDTRTATFVYNAPLPDGNYRATLGTTSAQDPAGHALAAGHSLDFFVLAADANRDRSVDLRDLYILALNWLGTGKTFEQGDFSYDGTVNKSDLTLLAARWQQRLDPPVEPAPLALTVARRRSPTRTATRVMDLLQ